jgi:alanyl-tRNA synthetase
MAQTVNDTRRAFLDFFKTREHAEVASGPIVPPNDPTLMFANAGMVQFKDVFTGRDVRSYTRATSSQKCIRIAGKHNDFEAVGPSPRHHTFFEMLGNFSFGDYFKEEAIVYAWEFLTKTLAIPTERLAVSYFGGENGVPADEVARDLWRKVSGLSDDRIVGMGAADNFWQMGETGPCGPCSELHYFVGDSVDASMFGQDQLADGTGWMEIWNLVFMQYDRQLADGEAKLNDLPKPCIDTGAGLERLAAVLQGKRTNYDTDLLRTLVEKSAQISGKSYGGTMEDDDVSMRVIADHARTTAFLMAEGITPDRNAREYVLRRVMRRAIRHGHRLGIEKPFLHEVTDSVIDLMGEQYPELRERRDMIATTTEREEVRFRETIGRGLGLLEDEFVKLDAANDKLLGGQQAFQLYDTYGFPLDLTEVICRERGFSVDMKGYEASMAEARDKSKFKGQATAVEDVYREALAAVPEGAVRFAGYDRDDGKSEVLAILKDGELVSAASEGDEIEVVTAATPFYGEAGGQVGDTGVIEADGARVAIADTQKPVDGLIVHRGKVESGSLAKGANVHLVVDSDARNATRRNHSVAHLLHLALHRVIGTHALQKGSHVGPERVRFDFTNDAPLTPEQIAQVEDIVNATVLENTPIRTELMTMEEARKRGAMMIFEEKYGDRVRMLQIGESTELCGGTHARATGDIGLFKIVAQSSVGSGVRRITGVTGHGAMDHLRGLEDTLDRANHAARAGGSDLAEKIEKMVARQKQLEKQITDLQKEMAAGGSGSGSEDLTSKAKEVDGVRVLAVRTSLQDRSGLRELAEQLRDKLGDAVVLVGSEADGKAQLVLTVSKSVTDRFNAGQLIRGVATIVGGSGGGRPDMAQAGGTEPAKLDEAIESLYAAVGA